MVRSIRRLETVAVAAIGVYHAFDKLIYAGVRLNQQYEDQALGIAALTSAKLKMVDATGKQLTSYEQFIAAQEMTSSVMDDIKKAALDTPASFQEMIGFYQQTIGHAISENQAFGKSMDEVNSNVIQFTQRMSALGSAAGMEMPKINEEIRSLMSGNTSTDSILAVMLFGSPTEANKAVKEAKTRVDGLSELLLGRLKPFENVQAVVTYTKALAQMNAAMDDIKRESMKPLFEDLKNLSTQIKDYLNENMDEFVKSWHESYEIASSFMSVIFDGVSDITTELGYITSATSGVGSNFLTWDSALLIVKQTLTAISILVSEVDLALSGWSLIFKNIAKLTPFTNELTENQKTSLQVLKDAEVFQKNGLTLKQKEGIKTLEEIRDGKINNSIAKTTLEIKKTTAALNEKGATFAPEALKASVLLHDAMKREYALQQAINDAKDPLDMREAYKAAIAGSRQDAEVQERINKLYISRIEKWKILNKMSGGRTGQTGGTSTGEDAEDAAKAAAAAAKAAAALEKKWAAYSAKRSQDMLQNQIDLISATDKWQTSLEGVAGVIQDVSKEFKNLAITQLKGAKAQDKLDSEKKKNLVTFAGDTKKVETIKQNYIADSKQLSDDLFTSQIAGYAAVAGAMSGAFAEGSTGAKAFMGIQQALSLYNAVTAMTAAWASAIFPYNLPAVAATGAAVGALLAQIGQTFTGGGSTTLTDAEVAKAEGVTGVESDSVENLLSSMDWTATRSLTYTKGIHDSLVTLDKLTDRIGVTIGSFESMSASDGNRTYDMVRYGITINPASLADLEAGIISGATTAAVKRTKTGLFGGTEESIKEYNLGGLNAELTEDLAEAYGSGIDSIRGAASALGMTDAEFTAAAANWETTLRNLNFMDKTQEEIAEMINGAIGADLDSLANLVGANVADYQKAGEGLFETMVRVAMEFEQVQEAFDKLGGSLVITGKNALEVTQVLIEASGGIENLLSNISGYIDNFYTDAEKQALRVSELTASGLFGDEDAYKARIEYLTSLSAAGNEAAATQLAELLRLQDTYREYFDENIRLEEEKIDALDDVNSRYEDLVDDRISAAQRELDFHEDILSRITAAYTGSINYMNSIEQSAALGQLAQQKLSTGNTQGYFDALYSQLEADKETSVTREEYAVQFDKYLAELQSANYEEKTTNDVVESLDAILEQSQRVEDAIRTSSYQSPIGV